jgi:hypothetical protein
VSGREGAEEEDGIFNHRWARMEEVDFEENEYENDGDG